jgi:hypothetical protein
MPFVESGPDLARGWGRVLTLQPPLELGPMLRMLTHEGDAPGLKALAVMCEAQAAGRIDGPCAISATVDKLLINC